METYRHRWIKVEGINAHYIEAGTGDPLILIHGGLPWSSGENNYSEVVGPLSDNFHVIAPDMPGFGYTAHRGPKDFSEQAKGDFLISLVIKLNLGPIFLAGNSIAGFCVQYLAHEHPDLVKKLIIINSLGGSSPIPELPEGKSYIFEPRKRYKKLSIEDIKEMLLKYYTHKDLVTDERVKRTYEMYLRNYNYTNRKNTAVNYSVEASNNNRSYKGRHISEWANELKMPVLLTWSEPGSKIEWGLNLFHKIPGCEMHLFPWSGHHLFTDQSERWVSVVTNWLKKKPALPPN